MEGNEGVDVESAQVGEGLERKCICSSSSSGGGTVVAKGIGSQFSANFSMDDDDDVDVVDVDVDVDVDLYSLMEGRLDVFFSFPLRAVYGESDPPFDRRQESCKERKNEISAKNVSM